MSEVTNNNNQKVVQIQKPITILREEFRNNIISQINNSQLPMFAIEGVLSEIISEVSVQKKTQLKLDIENYNKAVEEVQRQTNEQNEDNKEVDSKSVSPE